jgi:Zn-dependent membrane protease YugP
MFYYFDPLYFILIGPALLLSLFAQWYVKSTFAKYSKIKGSKGYTGAETARELLRVNGVDDVDVVMTQGKLSDHYDPVKKVLRLSQEVYAGRSLASVGVAAHEAGHAVQHATSYVPLRVRHGLFPVANIGSQLAFPLIIIGMIFKAFALAKIGIIFFACAVLFQIVTLPVEFNARKRALAMIEENGIVNSKEVGGAKAVLTSAALTYVAATAVAVMQLLYLSIESEFVTAISFKFSLGKAYIITTFKEGGFQIY